MFNSPAHLLFTLAIFALYWTPTIVAATRRVQGLGQIVVVNFFLGWTTIGWIVALVMSFRHVPKSVTYGQVAGQSYKITPND